MRRGGTTDRMSKIAWQMHKETRQLATEWNEIDCFMCSACVLTTIQTLVVTISLLAVTILINTIDRPIAPLIDPPIHQSHNPTIKQSIDRPTTTQQSTHKSMNRSHNQQHQNLMGTEQQGENLWAQTKISNSSDTYHSQTNRGRTQGYRRNC